jgi:glycosyltransferase involved in cell wall biosynthesis
VNVVYVANARMPTEKAHGFQICKMCEAWGKLNFAVRLIHPRRYQADRRLRDTDVFSYYGIERTFAVQTSGNVDIVSLRLGFSDRLFAPFFFAHSLAWAWTVLRNAVPDEETVYYTRDVGVAYTLTKLRLPTCYEVHSVPGRGQRWFLRRIANSPTLWKVIVLTSSIRDKLIELGFPAARIRIEPDAVDLAAFECQPEKQECRERLDLPTDRFIIGFVGRFKTLNMEKGILDLIDTLPILARRNHYPLLLCVGGPMDLVPTYIAYAKSRGVDLSQLVFKDRVANKMVPTWIKALDVGAAPYPDEPHYRYFMSPLKIFEYMGAGIPIVASDMPSTREVLRDSSNAILTEPGDPNSLANAFQCLIEQPDFARRIVAGGNETIQHYTWMSRATRILDADLFRPKAYA